MHFRCKTQKFPGGYAPNPPFFLGGCALQTPCSVIWKTPFKIPGYATGNFNLFWRKAEITRQKLDVNEPELPRKRKLPKRFEDGNAEPEFSSDCKQHFRQQYFEAIDLIVNSITGRFDQLGYKAYKNLQDLLINAIKD